MPIHKAPVDLSDDTSLRRFLQLVENDNATEKTMQGTYGVIDGVKIKEDSIPNGKLKQDALDYMSVKFFGSRCNINRFSRNFCTSAINRSDKGLGIYCEGNIYGSVSNDDIFVQGGIYSSTGGNVCFSKSSLTPGEIVKTKDILKIDANNVFIAVEKSSSVKDKKALGVCAKIFNLEDIRSHYPVIFDDLGRIKTEFSSFYHTLKSQNYNIVLVNSIGYGQIIVCSNNGNISVGDYICTSSIAGKGQKQNEEEYKNYTIAKALEDAVFTSSQDILIACEYK